ncbi:MAG: class I SAM-dependent methyltransferase [Actinomycetota bacterium]|nr:class I SAM-dependent methyltransferase [Actinomycetota bacterium]
MTRPGGLAITASEESSATPGPALPPGDGLRRTLALFSAFRLEQSDPDTFYRFQAADTVAWIDRHLPISLPGTRVLDIGGGAGYFSEAFAARGASSVLVEPTAGHAAEPTDASTAEARHRKAIHPGRLAPGMTVAGDGYRLPFADGSADLTFSSNVLEHVADPRGVIDELARVTKPGGMVYLSFNAWYSPNGGHETAPWHYFGGERAARRYERRHGHPPGNRFGTSLFVCRVGTTLRRLRRHPEMAVVMALPRYHPSWLRWVVHVPVIRELATWNLLVILTKERG